MADVAEVMSRYEHTIHTLLEQVQSQQQQIHELKSLLLFAMEQQTTSQSLSAQKKASEPTSSPTTANVKKVVPTSDGKCVATLGSTLPTDPSTPMYIFHSEEHELHWKTLVDGMVREALYAHMSRLDEQLACSIADRLRRVTHDHVVASVDKEFRRLRRRAALDGGYNSQRQNPTPSHSNSMSTIEKERLNHSRTLSDDIQRLKSVFHDEENHSHTQLETHSSSAVELTARLLSKLKSRNRLSAALESENRHLTSATDPQGRPQSVNGKRTVSERENVSVTQAYPVDRADSTIFYLRASDGDAPSSLVNMGRR